MLSARSELQATEQAGALLNPEQLTLFTQLMPGERYHAVMMVRKLIEQGVRQQDLLVAALLHDVGKLRYPLNPFERAMVVLVKAIKPRQARRWGSLPPNGWQGVPTWRKPFVLAEQHASWGAEMARGAGVSPLTEVLIREHHHPHVDGKDDMENSLLHKLWVVDNES